MTVQSSPGQNDSTFRQEKARPVTDVPVVRDVKKEPDACGESHEMNTRPEKPEQGLDTGKDIKEQPESPTKANWRDLAHCAAAASATATTPLARQAESATLQPGHRDETEVPTGVDADAVGGVSTGCTLRDRKSAKRHLQSSPGFNQDSQSGSDTRSGDSGSVFGGSDGEDSQGHGDEDGDGRPKKAAAKKQQAPSGNRAGEKHARNPREFVARLHAAEDEKQAREQSKRRGVFSAISDFRKRVRTGHEGREPGAIQRLQIEAATNPGDLNMTDAPEMPSFTASTHRQQWANLKKNVPHQADSRRTSTQKEDLEEATRLFGVRMTRAVDGKWLYKKMSTPLFSYQITAAAWMIKRELDKFEPKGGVLADSMGMGKTLMALACVAGNPPEPDDVKEFSKATLVVVPSMSVALSWMYEVKKHCTKLLGDWVCVYNPRDVNPLGKRDKYTVVITTYGVLRGQYPSDETIRALETKYEGRQSSLERALDEEMGFLFNHRWYRVILDEAHAIKNIDIRATRACCALKSKHNWAVTGTPLANSAEEFFPYLKFIRCSFTDSQAKFRAKYMTNGKANDGFETLVSMIMYRRTMSDTFMGNAIVKLPESNGQDVWVPLSREEKLIKATIQSNYEEEFKKLEEDMQARPDAEEDGEKEKAVKKLRLSTLTRLREAASHVFNLEKLLRSGMDVDEVGRLMAGLDEISPQVSVLDQIVCRDDGQQCLAGFETGVARLRELGEPVFGGMFDCRGLLERIANEKQVEGIECSGCHKTPPPEPIRFNPCGHCYCGRCSGQLFAALFKGSRRDDFSRPEPVCGHVGCGQIVDGQSEIPTLDSVEPSQPVRRKDKADEEAGRDSNGVSVPREADENSLFLASAVLPSCPLPPSAKLTATMAVICTWQKEAPEDKIIVFVQFIMTAKVLGRMLERAGISFLYLTGGLRQKQKTQALDDFVQDPSKTILISTMRCGGQSLNLTVANRVIIIEPWWNTTAEKQAYHRVLRIGQGKKSHLVRIMAHDSIDSQIFKLQGSKDVEINHALQDDGHVPAMLSDAQLEEFLGPEPGAGAARRKRSTAKAGGAAGTTARRR